MTFTFKHKLEITNEELAMLMYNYCSTIRHKDLLVAVGANADTDEIHRQLVLKLTNLWQRNQAPKKAATEDIWAAVKSVSGRT